MKKDVKKDLKSFQKGMYIPHYKKYTEDKPIRRLAYPDEVIIPLLQHLGETCEPLVEVGDRVEKGQKIGDLDEYWSAPVHASVDGEVVAIEPRIAETGKKVNSVVIKVDSEQPEYKLKEKQDINELSPDELLEAIREAGGVGMGGGACPTYINIDLDDPVDNLILNGAECEPFLTCDHRMMVEMADKVIGGAEVMMKIIGAKNGYIGIEVNKPDAIEVMEEKLKDRDDIEVVALDDKFPQGYKKNLIKSITGKEPPKGARSAEVGCIVKNIGTAIAAYEAAIYGKSCFERVVTVSGPDTVPKAGNYLISIGTPLYHVLNETGVDLDKFDNHKVVIGGAMTGLAQESLEVPVTKSTTGVLVLPPDMVREEETYYPCIRCGKCDEYCPMYLYPGMLSVFAESERLEEAAEWDLTECAECGICTYVCPSRRPVTHMIKRVKSKVKQLQRSKK